MTRLLIATLLLIAPASLLRETSTKVYRTVLDTQQGDSWVASQPVPFTADLAPGDEVEIVFAAPAGFRFRASNGFLMFRMALNDQTACPVTGLASAAGQVNLAGQPDSAPSPTRVDLHGCPGKRIASGYFSGKQAFSFREVRAKFRVTESVGGNFANAPVFASFLGSGISLEADAPSARQLGS